MNTAKTVIDMLHQGILENHDGKGRLDGLKCSLIVILGANYNTHNLEAKLAGDPRLAIEVKYYREVKGGDKEIVQKTVGNLLLMLMDATSR